VDPETPEKTPTANDYTYWLTNERTLIRRPMDMTLNPERLDLWSLRWVKDPDLLRIFRESPFELDALELPLAKKMERELREQFMQEEVEDAPVSVDMPEEIGMADDEPVEAPEEPTEAPETPSQPMEEPAEAPTPPTGNEPQMAPEAQGGPGIVWHIPGDIADGPDSVEDDGESMIYNYDQPQDRGRLRRSAAEVDQINKDLAQPEQIMAHDRAKRDLKAALLSQKKR